MYNRGPLTKGPNSLYDRSAQGIVEILLTHLKHSDEVVCETALVFLETFRVLLANILFRFDMYACGMYKGMATHTKSVARGPSQMR